MVDIDTRSVEVGRYFNCCTSVSPITQTAAWCSTSDEG
jgi:hypothetical protein